MGAVTRVLATSLMLLSAHCGRSDLSAPPIGDAAGPRDLPFKAAFFTQFDLDLWVWHSLTGQVEHVPWTYGAHPSYTYDGRYLVSLDEPQPPAYATCAFVVLDAHSQLVRRQVLPNQAADTHCSEVTARDPDASRLAILGGGGGVSFLATLDANGAYLKHDRNALGFMRYAPDGKTLVFYDDDAGTIDTASDDGSDVTSITPNNGGGASFSFDQRQLVFVNCDTYPSDCAIAILDLDSHSLQKIKPAETGTIAWPQFTPDGQWVVFLHGTTDPVAPRYALERVSISSGEVEVLVANLGGFPYGPPPLSVAADPQ